MCGIRCGIMSRKTEHKILDFRFSANVKGAVCVCATMPQFAIKKKSLKFCERARDFSGGWKYVPI